MTLCGYNTKIGAGLNLLIEGMASSMEEKAQKVGAIQALDNELFELKEMIEAMSGKGPIQDVFAGLNIFAEHLFLEVKKQIIAKPELSILEIMEEFGPKFISTIKYAEQYRESLNEDEILANNDQPIREVIVWVNENADKILKETQMSDV